MYLSNSILKYLFTRMADVIFPLIRAEVLIDIAENKNIVLIDARSGSDAKTKYLEEHLKGALFVDLEKQLADIKPDVTIGGRHPLPAAEKFAQLLGDLGIDSNSHVIVYDDKNGANAAARFWWMLRSIGHNNVQVLDGGYGAALKAGFPANHGEEAAVQKHAYNGEEWLLPTANMEQVEMAADDDSSVVIDVREKMRYEGEYEPIDLIAGHIPGAINVPYTNNLDEAGFFLPSAELRNKYLEILHQANAENMIVHCGSGVTACHTILAMDSAGLPMPTLYTGSWSEWSRNDKPIVTKTSD